MRIVRNVVATVVPLHEINACGSPCTVNLGTNCGKN